jgi:hypothetical protein
MKVKRAGGITQEIECLPSKHTRPLSLKPSTVPHPQKKKDPQIKTSRHSLADTLDTVEERTGELEYRSEEIL